MIVCLFFKPSMDFDEFVLLDTKYTKIYKNFYKKYSNLNDDEDSIIDMKIKDRKINEKKKTNENRKRKKVKNKQSKKYLKKINFMNNAAKKYKICKELQINHFEHIFVDFDELSFCDSSFLDEQSNCFLE